MLRQKWNRARQRALGMLGIDGRRCQLLYRHPDAVKEPSILNDEQFLAMVAATPLVSIDLVIRNERGEVLLGKRKNRPAQYFWFVPGGRIRKNERVAEAFRRICEHELGIGIDLSRATLIGVFDHIYPDNFAGTPGVNTHYVVLAHALELPGQTAFAVDDQHTELRWWNVADLRRSDEVHANTKAYFPTDPRRA